MSTTYGLVGFPDPKDEVLRPGAMTRSSPMPGYKSEINEKTIGKMGKGNGREGRSRRN
jgi:hypothetical protein